MNIQNAQCFLKTRILCFRKAGLFKFLVAEADFVFLLLLQFIEIWFFSCLSMERTRRISSFKVTVAEERSESCHSALVMWKKSCNKSILKRFLLLWSDVSDIIYTRVPVHGYITRVTRLHADSLISLNVFHAWNSIMDWWWICSWIN